MTRIVESAVVEAPADEVWRVVSDPRNLPRWNRYVRAVHDFPENGLREGDRYSTEMGGFGLHFHVQAEVLKIEPNRYSKIRLTGPLHAEVQTWVHPAGSRRSRLQHQIDYEVGSGSVGSVVSRALRHLGATAMLRRGVRAQKRQIEGS